ncbi:MAG: ABC-F type ribosomal protection protein [Defluviitaleaceae bacterium]|nr:ABC-F type ribosomal protection protein [Defluviitaleaceae bacterium]
MSLINVAHLTFAYEGSYDDIFTDVSFQIDTNWKLGFCGRNGRGKTTFLKLLQGLHKYQGKISANVNFEYFPFVVTDKKKNTVDVLYDLVPNVQLWEIEKELSKMDVALETLARPFETLSGGESTKVLLAGLFLKENSFLLIDEPTNHLDMNGRETVARYLNSKAGFILVSHDRDFLDECVDHVLSINKTNIEVQGGNFSSWFYNKEMQDDFERAENAKLKKEVKRLKKTAREKADWSDRVESTKIGGGSCDRGRIGHLAAKMMKKSKAIEHRHNKAVEEKSKLLKNIETAEKLKIHPLEYHTSRLITLDNVSVAYDGREIFKNLNFTLNQGSRLAISGGNGSGKSSLIKLLCGGVEDIAYTGQINVGSRLVISYVPQDANFLMGNLSDFAQAEKIDESLFKAILHKLDFSRVQFEKDMRDYSSGQKKKVLIARSLCQQAHVYIWDEPLNYIDILSRIQIEELLMAYAPTMIFVEHDRAFCRNIATESLNLS